MDSLVANITLNGDAKWTSRIHTLLEKMDDLALVCLSKSFLEDTKKDFDDIVRRGRELHELNPDCLPCPHLSKAIAVVHQLEEIIRSQDIGSFTVVRVLVSLRLYPRGSKVKHISQRCDERQNYY